MASSASRAMLDPYWLGGPDKHKWRTTLRSVVLLRRKPVAPVVEELTAQSAKAYAQAILQSGKV